MITGFRPNFQTLSGQAKNSPLTPQTQANPTHSPSPSIPRFGMLPQGEEVSDLAAYLLALQLLAPDASDSDSEIDSSEPEELTDSLAFNLAQRQWELAKTKSGNDKASLARKAEAAYARASSNLETPYYKAQCLMQAALAAHVADRGPNKVDQYIDRSYEQLERHIEKIQRLFKKSQDDRWDRKPFQQAQQAVQVLQNPQANRQFFVTAPLLYSQSHGLHNKIDNIRAKIGSVTDNVARMHEALQEEQQGSSLQGMATTVWQTIKSYWPFKSPEADIPRR